MNRTDVEARLRSAYQARTDQVTMDMLTHTAAPDRLGDIVPTRQARTHRTNWWTPLLAAAAVVALATGIVLAVRTDHLHAPPAVHTPTPAPTAVTQQMLRHGEVGTRQQIPWSLVGPQWSLAVVDSNFSLVDPLGGSYLIARQTTGRPALWSPDGRRAVLFDLTTATEVDLTSGAQTVLSRDGSTPISFTRPKGLAVLLASTDDSGINLNRLRKVGIDGKLQTTFPLTAGAAGRLGAFNGNRVLYMPDGSTFYVTAAHGLAVLGNDGTVRSAIDPPAGYGTCMPDRWMTDGVLLLASCTRLDQRGGPTSDLWLMPSDGSPSTPVTSTVHDTGIHLGFVDGWRYGSSWIVLEEAGCGPRYLELLSPNGSYSPIPGALSTGISGHVSMVGLRGGIATLVSDGVRGCEPAGVRGSVIFTENLATAQQQVLFGGKGRVYALGWGEVAR